MEIPAVFRAQFEARKQIERAEQDLVRAKECFESLRQLRHCGRVLADTVEEEWQRTMDREEEARRVAADLATAEVALTVAVARARRLGVNP